MSYSATDIITFIGVPLAVLGVLPILYNTVATLAALSKIKRMLRHGRLTALTRSDVVNHVIEVELPRYAVTPCDRFTDTELYWQPSQQPSFIPGGSWSIFNWRTRAIGAKTQRLEYADQLRQPQVDVAFDELIAYLLDLGAVPDAHGWKLLRATGLWTPTGCSLMNSPDGLHQALTIAPLDDSDGYLSLKANWSSDWTTRNFSSLPPYWIRLPPPLARISEPVDPVQESSASKADAEKGDVGDVEKGKGREQINSRKESLDSIQKQAERSSRAAITCQISVNGLTTAMSQEDDSLFSTANLQGLHIEHVRIRSGKSDGVWFASFATAFDTTSQTILWNYKIPDEILNFARRDTVPCGVLVLLGVVDESQTPMWASKYNANEEASELFFRRNAEQRLAVQAESQMSPPQREIAVRQRMQRELNERMQDMRDRMRLDSQRREARTSEALQSPKWDTKLVAEHNLQWLKHKGDRDVNTLLNVDASLSLKEVVGMLLHRMILDGQFASSICQVLDLWKAWADNGGMRRSDLEALYEKQELFALASLLVALVRDTVTAHEGTLSLDLQECLRIWKNVRLG
ncbi:hypothetical protein GGR53DRAFT_510569 [Hypoxylon sp. FL1150]|nr:hypothetical protein GGR53DRAFT_510569 [Hypoxylon sp. FL1150]